MSKHLLSVHLKEDSVQHVTALPLRSKERKASLQKLQNEGNFNHNVKVLQKGQGKLVVYRRPKTDQISACEYLPCEYCLAFIHEKMMWLHAKSCYFRPGAVDTDKNYVRNGRIMLVPFMQVRTEHDMEALDMVVMKMKETAQNPGLKNICFEDQLIREFGNSLLDKLGTEQEQRRKDQDNVRTKMRSVARLLQKLNENKLRSLPLSDYICGRQFMNVVAAVKELSQETNSPNLALTLGHYVKQICLLKASLGIQTDDMRKKADANNFKELYDAHWNSKVSCVASRTMRLRCLNKKEEIPQTEDLVKLKDYVATVITEGMKISNPTYEQYVELAQTVLARILIFNERRIAEVDELKIKDFENRTKGDTEENSEIVDSLGFSERALLKRMHLVEVRGKSTRGLRKVFVLLTPDMVAGTQHLLRTRIYAGVNPENQYIFGRTNTSPLDGCTAMRVVTESCPSLVRPELIRSRLLRKYLATTSQELPATPPNIDTNAAPAQKPNYIIIYVDIDAAFGIHACHQDDAAALNDAGIDDFDADA